MTKVNPDNENETKSDIFNGTYQNLLLFFIGRKIPEYFSGFHNLHFSILFQK